MPSLKSFIYACILLLFIITTRAEAGDVQRSKGQTVYVSAYSHVFTGPRSNPYNLAITLAIRNSDQINSFKITGIDYHDSTGKKVRSFTPAPATLGPLSSSYIHLEEKDTSGGFAPKFIVRWEAQRLITAPIIETIMIGATSGQGISFVSHGQVIQER